MRSYLSSMGRNGFLMGMMLLMSLGVMSQEMLTWELTKQLDQAAVDVRLDQLNNIYAVQRGEVVKMDPSGKVLTRYSNKMIGERVAIDVSNPMKVLIFSAEQMRLIFLDSRMSELREEVNLYAEGYEQISLAATSHSNGFWLYDPIEFRLIRYDQNFKKERESLNIAQMLRVEFFPEDLVEIDNRVYLTDPEHGIYVFDIFGNYLKRIPLKGVSRLKISDKRLFFRRADNLFAFHLINATEELVMLEGDLPERFDVNRSRICAAGQKRIFIFEPKR